MKTMSGTMTIVIGMRGVPAPARDEDGRATMARLEGLLRKAIDGLVVDGVTLNVDVTTWFTMTRDPETGDERAEVPA